MKLFVKLARKHPRGEMYLGSHLIQAKHTQDFQEIDFDGDPEKLKSPEVMHWFEFGTGKEKKIKSKPAEVSKKKKKKASRKKT